MSRVEGRPMVIALDGAHIRAVPGFQVRYFEVMVGRVERSDSKSDTSPLLRT